MFEVQAVMLLCHVDLLKTLPETARLRMLVPPAVTSFFWEIPSLMCTVQQMSVHLHKLVQAEHTLIPRVI